MKKILSLVMLMGLMGAGCVTNSVDQPSVAFLTPEDEVRLREAVVNGPEKCDDLEKKIEKDAVPKYERVDVSTAGVSLEVPYSNAWRVDGKRVTVVSNTSVSSVAFGPYTTTEGCGLGRDFTLNWKPKVSMSDLLKEKDPIDRASPEAIKVGSWEGVRYEWAGFCDTTALKVNVEWETFTLYASCQTDLAALVKVASSIKPLNELPVPKK